MLSSIAWFLAGFLGGALLFGSRSRHPRLRRPRSRRAWLDRANHISAALQDGAEREPLDFEDVPILARPRSRRLVEEAKRAMRPVLAIQVRVRE